MNDSTTISRNRFWLALVALVMSGVFAYLAFAAFFASATFEMATTSNPLQTDVKLPSLRVFDILGWLFLPLAPTCLWFAWKLRPIED